ncbi:hypothetical protein CHARACLAT_011267 [Characodon lateralis]|uniref:Uncharacterized protein n=1 Tax=Characodon lateralis TaxID=208331 RepID=A0ABU7CQI7_9TELE|nr:hypothetical protein [Characodon lateralis]
MLGLHDCVQKFSTLSCRLLSILTELQVLVFHLKTFCSVHLQWSKIWLLVSEHQRRSYLPFSFNDISSVISIISAVWMDVGKQIQTVRKSEVLLSQLDFI